MNKAGGKAVYNTGNGLDYVTYREHGVYVFIKFNVM